MSLPSKLKHMNMFNEGNSYLGVAAAVTLPKLGRKMESYRAAGMNGPVKSDQGLSDDGINLEWTVGGLVLQVIRQYGSARADGIGLRFAGSYQRDDTGETDAVEIVVRGRHEEIDMGEAKSGGETEHKIKTTCSYYKLTVNGRVEIEIDLLNFIEMVDGVDMVKEHRRNIGLA